MYDEKEIKENVLRKRKYILTELSVILVLMLSALVFINLNINNTVTFISVVVEFVLMFIVYKIFEAQTPSIYFSREIKGINIGEDEYISRGTPGLGLKWRQVGGPSSPQPFAPNTGANRRRTQPNIRGRVYLKLDDGNVVVLSSLFKAHTELYEEGDILLKYAGTKYPIIVGRKVLKQPCPICGDINDISFKSCHTCGLSIINEE